MTVQVEIIVLSGQTVIAKIVGRPVADEAVALADMRQLLDTEKFLERLTGCRFHINLSHTEETGE